MTDICNPPCIWIDGICYRSTYANQEHNETTPGYTGETEDLYNDGDVNEVSEELGEVSVETLDNGNYRAKLQVASAFFPQIIGKGGQTKTRLEIDTKTKIWIPRKGQDGDISVTGVNKRGVITACERIQVIVASARAKHPFTHFLSIPVNAEHVQEAFLKFRDEVLNTCEDVRGLDASIFQTPTLLHLTVGTMSLLDERERNLARELLEDCKESLLLPILNDCGLEFEISGLEIMNDDPSDVDVLYGKVIEKSGKLQNIVDALGNVLIKNLIKNNSNFVKQFRSMWRLG